MLRPSDALPFALLGLVLLMAVVTAWALVYRVRNHRKSRRLTALESQWHPRILDALERPEGIPALQAEVQAEDRLHLLVVLHRFARRVKGEEQDRLRLMARPFLPALERLLVHRKEGERAWGLRLLGTLGGAAARPRLQGALEDPSPLVTVTAIRELADPGYLDGIPRILDALRRLERWNRYFLATVLSGLGAGAAPAFRQVLMDPDEPTWLRVVVAETLLILNDIPSGDDVAQLVREASDRNLLISALNLLARVGREVHLPEIRVRLESPDFPIRAAAATALGGCGSREDLPLLLQTMRDPEPWVALQAARAVRDLGGREALDRIAGMGGELGILAGQVLREDG